VADEVRRGTQRTVVITEVQPASPAEAAGFKAGDELVKVGEMPVTCTLDLERGLLDSHPGKPTRLLVRRAGAESSLALDVRPLPRGMNLVSSEPTDMVWEILGLKTMAVSPDWVAAVSPKLRGGLYIEAVLPGSPAAGAAIEKGDILVGMNVGTRHWETIRLNYRRAAGFDYARAFVEDLYETAPGPYLSDVNRHFLERICQRLAIATPLTDSRTYGAGGRKSERLIELCRKAGADQYVSGPAARAYLDEEAFAAAGIAVTWFDYGPYLEYDQVHPPFEGDVSILDVLFCGGEDAPQLTRRVGAATT
jgi:hypothetical protein